MNFLKTKNVNVQFESLSFSIYLHFNASSRCQRNFKLFKKFVLSLPFSDSFNDKIKDLQKTDWFT